MNTLNSLSKNSTNVDIYKAFGDELKDGKTRIFSIVDSTTNPDRVTLFMCQESESTSNEVQSFFLGWSNNRLLRAVFSADRKIIEKSNLRLGSTIPFDILVIEKTEVAYEGQSAKINPSTGEVITSNKLPIYEHTSLVPQGKGRKVIALKHDEAVSIPTDFPGAHLLK